MIVEERNYTLAAAHLRTFLAAYEAEGLALQTRHLGRLIGYFTTETGVLNQVVHLWAYDDYEDRRARRTALWADPDWTAYSNRVLPWIERMETRLLVPTAFSPMR